MNVRSLATEAIASALAALEAERTVINDLNVYPVPDGDTGTNLVLTVRAVLEELQHSPGESIPEVAAAVTKGSLMGARGNSGVILSQIVRGACDVWSSAHKLEAADAKRGLAEASTSAYRAVREPVEGTMLTVIREMAGAAEAVPDSLGLEGLLIVVEEAGRIAVEKTTSQLPALQKAGVVDAGGYGLLLLFRGLATGLAGTRANGGAYRAGAPVALYAGQAAAGTPVAPSGHSHSELSEFRYCTSLLVSGDAIDKAELETCLAAMGDSQLAVGDPRMVKIHVHTNDPGAALTLAITYGTISEVEINDMHAQTKARDDRLRQSGEVANGCAVVAVVVGEGNQELFRQLGCQAIVDGGQSMNPSAAQLLAAIEELGAEEVVVLPNNRNIILAAEQAAGMSSRHVAVVPASSLPVGLAAMVAYDAELDAEANARAMEDAIAGIRSAEVTSAARDSELDGVSVRRGQAMGLVDGRLIAASDDLHAAAAAVFDEFAGGGAEYVTLLIALSGSPASRGSLEELAARHLPDAEVHIHEGGQPLYPILASAE